MDKRTFLLALGVGCAVLLVGTGYFFGRDVPFAQQAPLYEALRSTASIVFAVIGAWLAIVYPERLKGSLRGDGHAPAPLGHDNVALLLVPAVHSTFLLIVLLLVGIAVPLLRVQAWALAHVDEWRGISYALLVALTCWEVWIVFLTLFSTDLMRRQVQLERLHEVFKARFKR